MNIRAGQVYRHESTGKVFKIAEIWLAWNSIEGCACVRVSLDTCDEENERFVVGETQIGRWWPFLREVEENDFDRLGISNPKDDGLPWCDACNSYHHPANPTCKLIVNVPPGGPFDYCFTVNGSDSRDETLDRFEEFASHIRGALSNRSV